MWLFAPGVRSFMNWELLGAAGSFWTLLEATRSYWELLVSALLKYIKHINNIEI